MSKFYPAQTNFLRGELSPKYVVRTDLERQFTSALFGCLNFIVDPTGGARKRPGSAHVTQCLEQDGSYVFLPVALNENLAVQLEFGTKYVRVLDQSMLPVQPNNVLGDSWWRTGVIHNPGAIVQYDNGSWPARYICTQTHVSDSSTEPGTGGSWTSYWDIDVALWLNGVSYAEDEEVWSDISGVPAVFKCLQLHTSATATSRPVTGSDWRSYWVLVERSTAKDWGSVFPVEKHEMVFNLGQWYRCTVAHSTGTDTEPGVGVDWLTVWTATYEVTYPTIYEAGDLANIRGSLDTNFLYLAAVARPPQYIDIYSKDSLDIDALSFTNMPNEWVGDNWPAAVCLYEQRALWGGTPLEPQTIWGSVIGAPTDLDQADATADPVLVHKGYKYAIKSDSLSRITHMESGKHVTVFTLGAEYRLYGSNDDESVSISNIKVTRETNFGTANIKAINANNTLMFVQAGGTILRDFKYHYETNSYIAADISVMSAHLLEDVVVSMTYQQRPFPIIWMVTQSGKLIGCTYMPEYNLMAWHRHELGSAGNESRAYVMTASVLPGQIGDPDLLYMVVRRKDDEDNYTYQIEVIQKDSTDVGGFPTFLDGRSIFGQTGYAHFGNQEITVQADGMMVSKRTPNAAGVLSAEASDPSGATYIAGAPFIGQLIPMPLTGGNREGSSHGETKKYSHVKFYLYKSLGIKFGLYDPEDPDNTYNELEEIFFGPTDTMDEMPTFFTGWKRENWPGAYHEDSQLQVIADYPYPCEILAIAGEARTK